MKTKPRFIVPIVVMATEPPGFWEREQTHDRQSQSEACSLDQESQSPCFSLSGSCGKGPRRMKRSFVLFTGC